MTTVTPLRGPANPDAFRTQVYGARWYHDPLPACEIAEATDDKWPAISTVKRAWSKEFKKRHTDGNVYPLDPLRVALYVDENLDQLARMSSPERVPLMASAAQRDLTKAANRGTSVHQLLEALCAGDELGTVVGPPEYRAVCELIISELNPTILYAETVAISRTLGVGGTGDAFAEIGGRIYGIDWKSRGADSNHGAYETEAAQLGAYSLADYLIADVDGQAKRVKLPELDGLLVVSIKPDSYEVFPVDLDKARLSAALLVDTWKYRREGEKAGRAACGKPTLLGTTSDNGGLTSEWIVTRLKAIAGHPEARMFAARSWPDGVAPKGPWTHDEIERIDVVLTEAEAIAGAPFHDGDPSKPPRDKTWLNEVIPQGAMKQ